MGKTPTKSLQAVIGDAARAAREARSLTQADVAEQIGLSNEFYARIERGKALPSVPTLAKMAVALDESADALLGLDAAARKRAAPKNQPGDPPEIRRIVRRLRRARPGTLRLMASLLNELSEAERAGRAQRSKS